MAATASNAFVGAWVCISVTAGFGVAFAARPEEIHSTVANAETRRRPPKNPDLPDTIHYYPQTDFTKRMEVYRLHKRLLHPEDLEEPRYISSGKLWHRYKTMNSNPQPGAVGQDGVRRWFGNGLRQEQELKFAVDNIQTAARYMAFTAQDAASRIKHQGKVIQYAAKRANEASKAVDEVLPATIEKEIRNWNKTRMDAIKEEVAGDNLVGPEDYYRQLVKEVNKIPKGAHSLRTINPQPDPVVPLGEGHGEREDEEELDEFGNRNEVATEEDECDPEVSEVDACDCPEGTTAKIDAEDQGWCDGEDFEDEDEFDEDEED